MVSWKGEGATSLAGASEGTFTDAVENVIFHDVSPSPVPTFASGAGLTGETSMS